MAPRPCLTLADSILPTSSPSPSICFQCLRRRQISRPFSTTRAANVTRLRENMYAWINGPGAVFKNALPGSTNYLNAYNAQGNLIRETAARKDSAAESKGQETDPEADDAADTVSSEGSGVGKEETEDLIPFPNNRAFRSQPVLSEEHKDAIWRMVKIEGKSVRQVSAILGVEMNRVGAVVRLKGVEEQWKEEGKPLANAYARAMLSMLPVSQYIPPTDTRPARPHESINDLNTHRATKAQIFFPASESRQFTRVDAGQVFEKGLLPADERIPHPELVQMYADRNQHLAKEEVDKRQAEFYAKEVEERGKEEQRRREREKKNTTLVEGSRATFRIRNVTVDEQTVGKDGRGRMGVGARYGLPHQDRKKGQVKIPTRV